MVINNFELVQQNPFVTNQTQHYLLFLEQAPVNSQIVNQSTHHFIESNRLLHNKSAFQYQYKSTHQSKCIIHPACWQDRNRDSFHVSITFVLFSRNCSLLFQSEKALQNHKNKFCSNPKYNDLQLLQKQFQQKSKDRDISLYGKPSLTNPRTNPNFPRELSNLNQNSHLLGLESVLHNNNSLLLDKEYQSVLDQLTNKQSLKKKLQREKNQAYQELQLLDKRENDMLIERKHDELHEVLRRRQQLQDEEGRIQQEMRSYEAKKKEMEKQVEMVDKEDYIFKEARYAGKLAKQREILEEQKKEMEHKLKLKRKEKAEIQHRLNQSQIKEPEIYIPPNFRKPNQQPSKNTNRKLLAASNPSLKTPEDSLDSLSFQNTNRAASNSPYVNNHNLPIGPPLYNHQNVGIQHWPPQPQTLSHSLQNSNQYQSPLQRSTTEIFNLPHQKQSVPLSNGKPQPDQDTFPYFTPQKFSKNQKLLTDMLNKAGKSQEDAFIELLNAQEYDSLNLLSKLPKTSQLYQVKLKQYQEISRLRDDYKKEAHQKRIDKMKREFEYEKKIVEKEMQNAVWVDENRKVMLKQQISIVKGQEEWERDKETMNKQALIQKQQQQFMMGGSGQQQPQNQSSSLNNPFPNNQRTQTPLQQQSPFNNQNTINQNEPLSQQSRPSIPQSSNPYDEYLNQMQQRYSSQQQGGRNSNNGGENGGNGNNNNQGNSNTYGNNYNNSSNPTNNPSHNTITHSNPQLPYPLTSNQSPPGSSNPSPPTSDYQWGYKITIQTLRHYTRSKPIKIKIILKEHDITSSQQQKQLKRQFSTTYHYEKIPPQQASFNPNMNNKFDQSGKNVVWKEEFTVLDNLQELYNLRQNQIYLWVFALEKDQTKLSNEPSIYAWYNLKLTHFGQLKEGKITLNLYADQPTYPNPSDMNRKKNKLKEEIVIELNQVLVEKEKPPQIQEPLVQQGTHRPPQIVKLGQTNNNTQQTVSNATRYSGTNQLQPPPSNQSNRSFNKNQQQPTSQTSIINQMGNTRQSNTSTNDPPFIPLEFDPQFLPTKNNEPKNLDITLTQLRTLPSYTGPVKIQLSFIDSEGVEILPREEVLTDTGSQDMYNPFVNYVKKIRGEKLITPTTMIFIRFLALNALDYEIYMLGFTVFYLFFNDNGDPCPSNDTKEFLVSTGFYQLPIFWGSCTPFYAKIDQLIEQYPLIPCTSLLFGCHINVSEKLTKIPKYGEKVYNTTLFHAQENEIRLFQEQYKREKLDSNKVLNGYLKFKGFTTGYTPDQMQKYFFKAMAFTKDNTKNLFPLEYMAEYNQFFGIYFSVDKLTIPDPNQNYYYFMTVCLSPPAKYYTSKLKDTEDLKMIWAVDAQNSKRCELMFHDNEMVFEPKYDMNTCLIVEFKRIKVGKENELSPEVENYAYVIVPLFKQIEEVRCVNVSHDTVNTYPGAFNFNDIGQMKKDLASYLDKLGESAQPSEIQFSFRLMNGYFTTQFSQDKPPKPQNRKTSYFSWYSRPIDFEDANRKVKSMIQRKYAITL